jgi:hypothetical protein
VPSSYQGGAIPQADAAGYTREYGAVGVQAPPFASPLPIPGGQPPARRSRRWIWVLVAIFGVAILLSCSLCGWATYSLFTSTLQQISGSLHVANDYYHAVQAQNYDAAYGDLAPQGDISGLTLSAFTQQAQQRDNVAGPVLSYDTGQPAYGANATTGTDPSRLTVTVDVTRKHTSYTALLTLRQIGNAWKIVDFDRI